MDCPHDCPCERPEPASWGSPFVLIEADEVGWCRVNAVYMQGLGADHVVLLPSGAIVFRFMDENDLDIGSLVRRVERVRSSCQ